jgi:hypothetical protein
MTDTIQVHLKKNWLEDIFGHEHLGCVHPHWMDNFYLPGQCIAPEGNNCGSKHEMTQN